MENNKEVVTTTETVEEVQEEKEVQEVQEKQEKPEKKERYFTRDELNKILAAEKEKAKEEVVKEFQEAERLKNMSAEQKAKELEKKRQREFEEKEKEVNFREMKLQAIDILNEEKLPIKAVDFVVAETAEETQKRIADFKEIFSNAVEEHTEKKLKGSTPKEVKKQEPVDPFLKGFDES
jgi:hypothetical protein